MSKLEWLSDYNLICADEDVCTRLGDLRGWTVASTRMGRDEERGAR